MASLHTQIADTTDPPSTSSTNPAASDFSALKQLLSTKQSDIKQLLEELQYLVNRDIQLPRIVACGDQSSGKSSVLEAISNLSFPRAGGTCTKFATELSLSNKPGQDVWNVSTKIRWDSNPTKSLARPTTLDDLANDIAHAHKAMEEHNTSRDCTFFKDILRIEASHAQCPDLTLIDLPGIVHDGKGERDSEFVLEILERYLCEEKTIILAVFSAEHDVELQAIMKQARKFDPKGDRTMGIITKPDRLEGSTLRDKWVNIASNNDPKYKFKHGWHVVRNRGPLLETESFEKRDQQEKEFFESSPWQQLGASQLGVEALRIRLSEISETHIERALPEIYNQLERQHDDCFTRLSALGPPRSSTQDHVQYLTSMSTKFNRLTNDAIEGLRDSALYVTDDDTFCSQLYERYRSFGRTIQQWGQTVEINDNDGHASGGHQKKTTLPPVVNLNGRMQTLPVPETKTTQEFLDWIQQTCGKRRGREMGLPDPLHINKIFRAQSKNWRMIAEAHLNSVWKITQDLLLKAAQSSVTEAEAHTADALVAHLIMPEMAARKQRLVEKLNEILRPYEQHCAIPTDPDFQELYDILQRDNRKKEFPDMAAHIMVKYNQPGTNEYEEGVTSISNRLSTFEEKTPVCPSGPNSLLNLMTLYYKGALKTFTDNVILLVVEGTLLHELAEIFSPDRVQQLHKNPEDNLLLQTLAIESEDVIRERQILTKKQKRLKEAMDKFSERLGHSTLNTLKMKFAASSYHIPTHSSEGDIRERASETSLRDERRPSISVSRPLSSASDQSIESALSATTTLTVPSISGSQGKGRRGSTRFRGTSSTSAIVVRPEVEY